MYDRGSEWRVWDLQVHTPASILNNQFGNNWDEYVYTLFSSAIKNNIAVIGVTDYYSIDGYKNIKNILKNNAKLSFIFQKELETDKNFLDKVMSIKLLPCIEFRFKDVVNSHGHDHKIEANIILNDELSIDEIENLFISSIHFTDQNNNQKVLNEYNIKELGKEIKETQQEFQNKSDFVTGLECLTIDFMQVVSVLKENEKLKNNFIILIPEDDITHIDWSSPSTLTRKKYYLETNGLFSINEKSIKWGLQDSTKNEFKSYKPCFSCSDCHKYEEMFKFKSSKKCWIKADPTFLGLKQVFFQPSERLFLGDCPLKLQQVNSQKFYYIDRLNVIKNIKAKNQDNWFNTDLKLNPGLITIIGNKGSGKSALADIIGYMADSKNMAKASFLTNNRFKKEDKKYADDYQGKLFWKDGRVVEKNTLNDEIQNTQSVEYLPQKFIEELCNELNDKFQEEIDKVIFSYIDISEKNNCTNLSELIANKTTDIDYKIKKYRSDIDGINEKIINLENKSTAEYKKNIELKLKQKKHLLESNSQNKPIEVKEPISNISGDELKTLNSKIAELEKTINDKQDAKLEINILIDKIKQFIEKFNFAKNEISLLVKEGNNLFKELGLQDSFNVDISSNINQLERKLNDCMAKKDEIENQLNEHPEIEIDDTHSLLMVELRNMLEEREKILVTAHESEIKYQKYLDDLKIWQTENEKLEGKTENDEDTIKYYVHELQYITEDLYTDYEKACEERQSIVNNIYELYLKKMETYKLLYKPIEEKLQRILSQNSENIEFETIININKDFRDRFISYIHQNVDSPYKGKVEGKEYLNSIIRSVDFNTYNGIKLFVEKLQCSISENKNTIKKLVPNTLECYNYLNKLEYLNISFTLKLDGKMLNELSPGQRGNVLLIFYLALSKNEEPIIIDQPEDNLDNQSVYDKLVPCILEAKKHRQVIIVTHNPNIAIACDAEQIICSKIDKKENRIEYISGSIENEQIRKHVVDILEGTLPAFTLRRLKYFE